MAKDVETISWLAGFLGVSTTTIYRMLERDPQAIPGCMKIGGQWRVIVPVLRREWFGDERAAA